MNRREYLFLLLLLVVCAIGCTSADKRVEAAKKNKVEAVYTQMSLTKDICITDNECIDISLDYPRFTKLEYRDVEQKINFHIYSLIKEELKTIDPDIENENSLQEIVDEMITHYKESVGQGEIKLSWDIDLAISVVQLAPQIIEIEVKVTDFTGGAHANTSQKRISFSAEEGSITNEEIFS